jgi:hypothetical protein
MKSKPPTISDVRDSLREYFQAKHALEASEAHTRFLRARRRIRELSLHTQPDHDSEIQLLVLAYGGQLFTAPPSLKPSKQTKSRN